MVGQGLGAGKPERAEKAVWIAGFYNMLFLGLVGSIFVAFTPAIVSLYTDDAGNRRSRDQLLADRELRVRVLCLRHGADPVVQRRR